MSSAPKVTPVGNFHDLLESVPLRQRPAPPRSTHQCGVCRRPIMSARWRLSGLLVHVERHEGGDIDVVPELFPTPIVHVEHRARGEWREHECPRPASFTGRAARKVR